MKALWIDYEWQQADTTRHRQDFVLLIQRCKSSGETGWERLQTRDLYSNYKSSTKVLLQSSSCLFSFPQKWPPLRTYLFLPLQSSFHVQYCLSCEATHALCIEIMDTIFDEYVIVLNDWGVNCAYSICYESFSCGNRVNWVTRLLNTS